MLQALMMGLAGLAGGYLLNVVLISDVLGLWSDSVGFALAAATGAAGVIGTLIIEGRAD
jgi:hypothetical protein